MIPIIIFSAPVFALLLFIFRSKKINAAVVCLYALIHLSCTVLLLFYPISFGRYFECDPLNLYFLLVLSLVLAGVSVYNMDFILKSAVDGLKSSYYSAAILVFAASMSAVVLGANLGLMWVCLEATTIAGAYLIFYKEGKEALEAAWKYMFICSIGIAFAFVGMIFLSLAYTGSHPSLFFRDIDGSASSYNAFWLKLSFVFMVIGFGTKAGLAPVHAWLPDAHSEAPSPVSALLSAALLNSAMLVILKLLRVMKLGNLGDFASVFMLVMGMLSVFVAAVYIIRVNNYKRMLAYSSIENMGIITICAALGGEAAFAAILHTAAHSLSKASLFVTSGNILKRYSTKEINNVTGLLKSDPKAGWLWIAGFIAIAGIPPSPAFLSEFLLIETMFAKGLWWLAIALMLLLTIVIFGMALAMFKMSFGNAPKEISNEKFNMLNYAGQMVFIAVLCLMGLYMPHALSAFIGAAAGYIM
jgi:hydrogenase-4 component F